ncbi:MAG: glycosyltransferase family 2 protein [Proteobacteria bacterium]|uniref:glycosyltransferase family 2 protein n=1 Tax=Rudaea sp. TaxID=2136325 RepID=UPI0037849BBC|nr:glycosyltransferase family 2 protein [Pseudomonadota bacterium]
MPAPLVSVVIPGFNCAQHVVATLESVFAQTHPNIEVIFVDDGSTDDTPKILEQFRQRITIIRTKNGGLGAARNAGMAHAQGEYIAWLDGDDLCEPERIAVQASFLAHRPEVAVISTAFSTFNEEGLIAASGGPAYYTALKRYPLDTLFSHLDVFTGADVGWLGRTFEPVHRIYWGRIWERLILGNFMHPPTLMMRRDAQREVGNLSLGMDIGTDWDYILRLAHVGPAALVDTPLLKYRRHGEQMSGRLLEGQLTAIRVLQALLARHGDELTELRPQIERKFAQCHALAAYFLAEESRSRALSHLVSAALRDPRETRVGYHLSRIIAGRSGLALLRRLRRQPTVRR